MRPDLLALTDDDLVALTNRGTVKRARQEVEAGAPTGTLTEDAAGAIAARWSDGVECAIPAGKPLAQGRCSCPAPLPCRHLVRTALAYQRQRASAESEAPAADPWDPGAIPDEALRAAATQTAANRAARLNESSQVFELVRSLRPSARCHSVGVTVRFLVPGDPAYTVCDCGQPSPCEHAILAVRAFRDLPAGTGAGLVACGERTAITVAEQEALAAGEAALEELVRVGLADLPAPLRDRLRRVEEALRRAGLVWPAEILAEIGSLKAAYDARDARFDPLALAEAVGEWIVRCDALRSATGAVPQLFVRGATSDRTVEIATARLTGLGCTASALPRGIRLTALLHDDISGQVVAVVREFADGDAPRDLAALAAASVARGVTLAALGRSHVLVRGGKRAPGGEFSFGRAPLSAHPQAFSWERLRAPTLAEGFGEVAAHLAAMPPRALRPRRLGTNLQVVPLAAVERFGFDAAVQATVAVLRDSEGGQALLVHPYRSRARGGTAALLAALSAGTVRFVAGFFRGGPAGLACEPIGVVTEDSGARHLIQPAIDPLTASAAPIAAAGAPVADSPLDPDSWLRENLPALLGDLLITGVEAAGETGGRRVRELARTASALGFSRLIAPLERLAETLTPAPFLELAAVAALHG